jgi:hypothetical protein
MKWKSPEKSTVGLMASAVTGMFSSVNPPK